MSRLSRAPRSRARSSRVHRIAYASHGSYALLGGARSASRRSAIASRSASLLPMRLYSGTGDTPRRDETLRMLTASRPNSWRISTAAVMISSASRSKSGCLVTRSHHHHKLADHAAVSHPLKGVGEVVERDLRRHGVAQPTVSHEAGEAGVNAVELL